MRTIDKAQSFFEFISSREPSLVLFVTRDCAVCASLEKKLLRSLDGERMAKLYLDDLEELKGETGIFSVPAVVVYISSKEYARFVGVFSAEEVVKRYYRLKELV